MATQESTPAEGTSATRGENNSQNPLEYEWLQCVHHMYPELLERTYFLPPLHFNRVPCRQEYACGEQLLLLQNPCGKANQTTGKKRSNLPKLTSQKSQADRILDCHVRGDGAVELLRHNLSHLVENTKSEVMMIMTQLNFGQYVSKPCYAAAAAHLPRPITLSQQYKQGDFDLLIIHRKYGLITGEVKSVGGNFLDLNLSVQQKNDCVIKRIKKAIKQLYKAETVLKHLVSDMSYTSGVIKTIILPFIQSSHLLEVVTHDKGLAEELKCCLQSETPQDAVQICLCSDQIISLDTSLSSSLNQDLSNWWTRLISRRKDEPDISEDVYKQIIARFCGPATAVEINCVDHPRLEIRTENEGIAETGNRMSMLCLYPEQLAILNEGMERTFLTGPPGTGKSVMLYLKGRQWMEKGHDLNILCVSKYSRASSFLLEHLLHMARDMKSGVEPGTRPQIQFHNYDFHKKEAVASAVSTLEKKARNGQLCIIADEIGITSGESFEAFCTQLFKLAPTAYIWAASVYSDNIPCSLTAEYVTVPLRSPPAIVREVQRSDVIGHFVSSYTRNGIPSPTDGPAVERLYHACKTGHTSSTPLNCEQCGRDIAKFLTGLSIGNRAHNMNERLQLHYRDILVLCGNPLEDRGTSSGSRLIQGLQECQVPVQVIGIGASDAEIRQLVHTSTDKVFVADLENVYGLERKVVVVIGNCAETNYDRLFKVSRCTSQLVWIDYPSDSEDSINNDSDEWDEPDSAFINSRHLITIRIF